MSTDPQALFEAAVARHQRGDLARAIAGYEAVLASEPRHVGALANLASALRQAGRPGEALARFEEALALEGRLPELWFNYANLLHAQGRSPQAERAYRQALTLDSTLYQAHFNLGRLLQQQERLTEAEPHYREAIRLEPRFARAHGNLGNLLRAWGRLEEAIAAHREAICLAPEDADGHFNLGNALLDAQAFQAAAERYRKALEKRPGHTDAWVNLGNALEMAGDTASAREAYERALALAPGSVAAALGVARLWQAEGKPDRSEVLLRQALALHPQEPRLLRVLAGLCYEAQRYEEAAALYQRALIAAPDHADTLNALGVTLYALGRVEETLACWRRAFVLAPAHVGAHTNLGTLYRTLKRHPEAIEHLREALRLAPEEPLAQASLAFTLLEVGEVSEALTVLNRLTHTHSECVDGWMALGYALTLEARIEEALQAFERAQALAPQKTAALSNTLFALLYSDRHDAATITRRHCELAARLEARAGPPFPRRFSVDPDQQPLRIGYLSPDLRGHPVGFFLEPILAHHRPQAVEVTCYSLAAASDEVTARLRALVPHWRGCHGWSDERLGNQIQEDGIDILVELVGHTAGNRMTLLTRRPAPVQVLYLGYPCTSGLAAIDYLIADRWVSPPEQAHLYSERVMALEGSFLCFQPPLDAPPVAPPPLLEQGHVTFGCFNHLAKCSESCLALWARVLHAVPGARLVLKALSLTDAGTRERLWFRFEALGIERGRIDLLPPSRPLSAYLAEYARIDIGLDPLPYTGGTTTCEALWMGVPVVTLAGEHFYARMGLSLLQTVGLPGLIAYTAEEYVAIAVELAADLARLTALREGLRARVAASPLGDGEGFTQGLERAYRAMWQEHSDGQAGTARTGP